MTEPAQTERITYARQKLLNLVQNRELRSWCMERNLPLASFYKLAVGQSVPTFKAISYLVLYTPPRGVAFIYGRRNLVPYPHTS